MSLAESPKRTPTFEIVSPRSDAALIESMPILIANAAAAAVATLKAKLHLVAETLNLA
jgi:hypothetical protein